MNMIRKYIFLLTLCICCTLGAYYFRFTDLYTQLCYSADHVGNVALQQNKTFRIVFYTAEVELNIPVLNCVFTYKKPWNRKTDNSSEKTSLNTLQEISMKVFEKRKQHVMNSIRDYDAVIFHVKDMPGSRLLNLVRHHQEAVRKEHGFKQEQLWAYYNKESAYNTINLRDGKYDGLFDITITPLQTSDVPAPYGYHYRKTKVSENLLKQEELHNDTGKFPHHKSFISFTQKENLVAWIASHCNEPRDRLVSSLLAYMPVHVIGKCGKKYKQYHECIKNTNKCNEKLQKYKFILAFENSYCKDYVTEKYWNALNRGNIPIVYGGSSYDETLVIPGSFINVKDFKSVEKLAQYILYLSKNQAEYDKYFKWRDNFVMDFKPNDRHRFEIITKNMCIALNRKSGFKKKYKLSEFYGRKENCEYETKI